MSKIHWLLLPLLLLTLSARADLVVVGNPGIEGELTRKQLHYLYLGKSRLLPTGSKAVLFEYARGHSLRTVFARKVIKRSAEQIASRRQKYIVSGKMRKPSLAEDRGDMLERIATTPNSVGYIDSQYLDDRVKVLFRIAD